MSSSPSEPNKQMSPGDQTSDDRLSAFPVSDLLHEVLRKTRAPEDEDDEPGDLQLFREVARRHARQKLDVEPVGVELVHAALIDYFQTLQVPRNEWQKLAAQIARTLLDDPGTHARMQRLWARLLEDSQ